MFINHLHAEASGYHSTTKRGYPKFPKMAPVPHKMGTERVRPAEMRRRPFEGDGGCMRRKKVMRRAEFLKYREERHQLRREMDDGFKLVRVCGNCYGRGRHELRRKPRLPELEMERIGASLMSEFKCGPHLASFTMEDIGEEAKGVFRHVRLDGVRRSLRGGTRRLMNRYGKFQVSWITRTTLDESKDCPLLYRNEPTIVEYVE